MSDLFGAEEWFARPRGGEATIWSLGSPEYKSVAGCTGHLAQWAKGRKKGTVGSDWSVTCKAGSWGC